MRCSSGSESEEDEADSAEDSAEEEEMPPPPPRSAKKKKKKKKKRGGGGGGGKLPPGVPAPAAAARTAVRDEAARTAVRDEDPSWTVVGVKDKVACAHGRFLARPPPCLSLPLRLVRCCPQLLSRVYLGFPSAFTPSCEGHGEPSARSCITRAHHAVHLCVRAVNTAVHTFAHSGARRWSWPSRWSWPPPPLPRSVVQTRPAPDSAALSPPGPRLLFEKQEAFLSLS